MVKVIAMPHVKSHAVTEKRRQSFAAFCTISTLLSRTSGRLLLDTAAATLCARIYSSAIEP